MTTITCDRCGVKTQNEMGRDPRGTFTLETMVGIRTDEEREIIIEADLCRVCHDALGNWLKSAPLP